MDWPVRILMVTPYPPVRDGIAAYAVQLVARLRSDGHDVEVLSPGPSAAHHHLELKGWRGPLALAKRVRGYDKVVIQFHPDVFYPQPFDDRTWAAVSYGLALVFRLSRDIEVRVHETDYSRGKGDGTLARAVRFMWKAAPKVVVHTEAERQSFHESFGVPLERVGVAEHGAHFVRRTSLDKAGARASLGIPVDQLMFLSIGFIQPHKGFDRAIRAFGRLGAEWARLDVVGSLRLDGDQVCLDHLEELRSLAAATPGATVHAGYVSDEKFDRWVVAADALVLPYRHIWSSGVMERAALYDRPVIVTRVGGLVGQARANTIVVDSDEELLDAMRAAAGLEAPPSPAWPLEGPVDRSLIMAEVQERASRERALPAGVGSGGARASRGRASLPLRRLPPLAHPSPTSARPGAGMVKRLERRLTAWQVDPIIDQVNRLREASIETADRLQSDT